MSAHARGHQGRILYRTYDSPPMDFGPRFDRAYILFARAIRNFRLIDIRDARWCTYAHRLDEPIKTRENSIMRNFNSRIKRMTRDSSRRGATSCRFALPGRIVPFFGSIPVALLDRRIIRSSVERYPGRFHTVGKFVYFLLVAERGFAEIKIV